MTTDIHLQCFIDPDRRCGPDCMAYTLRVPEGEDYKGESQWAHCTVLVSMHRLGKHSVILASVADDGVRRWKSAMADRARSDQPKPPSVK